MTESLHEPFERISISEETIASAQSYEVKIPILDRSLKATAISKKLCDVSPVCVLVVGMAGSGKTTLMAALQRSLAVPGNEEQETDNDGGDPVGYCLNLDPATKLVPFGASIDIRDTVDYKVRILITFRS